MKFTFNSLYIITLASVILLSGCKKEEISAIDKPDADKQEIKFKFFVEEGDRLIPYEDYWNAVNPPMPGPVTRVADNDLSSGFLLFGFWNTMNIPDGTNINERSNEAAPESQRFFNAAKITKDGVYSGSIRYWIADGKTRHSFAAISGIEDNPASYLSLGFEANNMFIPVASYSLQTNISAQQDLLTAYGPVNITLNGNSPVVNIHFKHVLSKLIFKMIVNGGVTLYDCNLSLRYNSSSEIPKNMQYQYTGINWSVHSGATPGAYVQNVLSTLATNFIVPSTAIDEDNSFEIESMFMHSGIEIKEGWVQLEFAYAKAQGGAKKTVKTYIPSKTLQPGCQYTYYLYISELTEELAISNIQITPWTTDFKLVDPLN